MNVLREKITFLTDKFIPASIDCIDCGCICSKSVYSLEADKNDICIYLHTPTYSILTYVILKDPYVNYNNFMFARILGIDISKGLVYETIEEMKKYLLSCDMDSNEIKEYRKVVYDYDIALSIPYEKIKELRDKYNVENHKLYIETIQKYDNSFNFDELEL